MPRGGGDCWLSDQISSSRAGLYCRKRYRDDLADGSAVETESVDYRPDSPFHHPVS